MDPNRARIQSEASWTRITLRHVMPLVACVLLGLACAPADDAAHRVNPLFSPSQYDRYDRDRYSVLLFLVDTLRSDHLGCYGYARETSPALDALSRDGILFERCLAQSSWTKPATASILTGLYPSFHRLQLGRDVLPATVVPVAKMLKDLGYKTAAFVANGWIYAENVGFDRGFDHFVPYRKPDTRRRKPAARELVDDALEWIEANRDEPTFVYIHVIDPHAPYLPLEDHGELFQTGYDGPIDGDYGIVNEVKDITPITLEEWDHLRSLYDGEIAYTDRQLARLLDGLRSIDRYDETLSFFVSDHGEEFNDHEAWRHPPHLYEEVVNVPLVARFPRLSKKHRGVVHSGVVQQVDIVPTILDVLGEEIPDTLHGTSLLERMFLEESPHGTLAYSEVNNAGIFRKAVVKGSKKYIRQWNPDPMELLFDLREDPGEKQNLVGDDDESEMMRATLDMFVTEGAASLRGYHVLFKNPTDTVHTLDGFIHVNLKDFDSIVQIDLEDDPSVPDAFDPPIQKSSRDEDGVKSYTVTMSFSSTPGDRDHLCFEPHPDSTELRVRFNLNDRLLPPERIFLGPEMMHPRENPFRLDLAMGEAIELPDGTTPDDPTASDPFVWIWKAEVQTTALSDDLVKQLEAIGYFEKREDSDRSSKAPPKEKK